MAETEAEARPAGVESGWAPISVVMTVLNEGSNLRDAVGRVLSNGYPGDLELAIAVGPSTDDTAEVAADLVAEHPGRVLVISNPSGRTPDGLNAAIAATRNPIIVRVDGHGFLDRGYIQKAVEILTETGAANVGGLMVPHGTTPFQSAVACAMSSRIGIGNAAFHTGGQAGPALSVYLGVFRRDVLERLGGFDTHFARAQDWELNHRIRQAGELVWFDPRLRVRYHPRSTYRELVRQFYSTGRWRREVVRRYPETASVRYLAPSAAVVGVASGLVAGGIGASTGHRSLLAGLALPGAYVTAVVLGAGVESRGLRSLERLHLPVVIMSMHMSWGLGFLRGL